MAPSTARLPATAPDASFPDVRRAAREGGRYRLRNATRRVDGAPLSRRRPRMMTLLRCGLIACAITVLMSVGPGAGSAQAHPTLLFTEPAVGGRANRFGDAGPG